MLKKLLIIFLLSLTLLSFSLSSPTLAENTADGAKIFEAQCVGCHVGGGNIIRRGKTLKQKALHSNHVDTLETMESFVAKGKNVMPAYQDRLTEEELQAVSQYVLEQAEKDWK